MTILVESLVSHAWRSVDRPPGTRYAVQDEAGHSAAQWAQTLMNLGWARPVSDETTSEPRRERKRKAHAAVRVDD